MRREYDGRSAFIEFSEEVIHLSPELYIHARCRLIEDEDIRIMHERTSNHESALHPTRERASLAISLFPETESTQVLLGVRSCFMTVDTVVARLSDDDVPHLFKYPEVELLWHDADLLASDRSNLIDILPVDNDRTRAFFDQSRDNADSGRLPCSVGTEEREEVALVDGERESREGNRAACVGFREVTEDENGRF